MENNQLLGPAPTNEELEKQLKEFEESNKKKASNIPAVSSINNLFPDPKPAAEELIRRVESSQTIAELYAGLI